MQRAGHARRVQDQETIGLIGRIVGAVEHLAVFGVCVSRVLLPIRRGVYPAAVLDVLLHGDRDLLQVALADRPPAPLPHRREHGKQDGCKGRHDGDHDQ